MAVSTTPSWASTKRWSWKESETFVTCERVGKVGAGSTVWRQPSSQHVEQDHDRAGQEQRCDQAEADQQGIDAGIIGQARRPAHDLALAAVEKKRSVHLSFLLGSMVQAIGRMLVAELTNSMAVRKAAAKTVAVSRAELRANMAFPFFHVVSPWLGHAKVNAGSVPNWKYRCFSVRAVRICKQDGVQCAQCW